MKVNGFIKANHTYAFLTFYSSQIAQPWRFFKALFSLTLAFLVSEI